MRKLLTAGMFIFVTLFVGVRASFAQSSSLIEDFDLRFYHPEQFSLKDLVFDVRIKDLTEIVKQRIADDKVKEVYFKVFWQSPGRYGIDVMGLPKGFEELKAELRMLVASRIDFVIPEKMAPKFRSYTLKTSNLKKGKLIVAEDESNARPINRMELEFEEDGKIKKLTTFSPGSKQTTNYELSVKPWSHNKWVLDRIESEILQGEQRTKVNTALAFKSFEGFGFPVAIGIETIQFVQTSDKQGGVKEVRQMTQLTLDNILVNSGKANEYFRSKDPPK
jgi:hypothetical protein